MVATSVCPKCEGWGIGSYATDGAPVACADCAGSGKVDESAKPKSVNAVHGPFLALKRYSSTTQEAEAMFEDDQGQWVRLADVIALFPKPFPFHSVAFSETQCAGGGGWNECQNPALKGCVYCADHCVSHFERTGKDFKPC